MVNVTQLHHYKHEHSTRGYSWNDPLGPYLQIPQVVEHLFSHDLGHNACVELVLLSQNVDHGVVTP